MAENSLLLQQLELNWIGHEGLFVQLLKLRNSIFAFHLIDGVAMHNEKEHIGVIEIGAIEWWLEWLSSKVNPEKHWWFQNRLSLLFAYALKTETKDAFLAEFNKRGSIYREVLAQTILLARADLSTDDFSEDALSYLLQSLLESSANISLGHLLGHTATETFVTERLMPLYLTAQEPLKTNLMAILAQAGSRHGRRYILS